MTAGGRQGDAETQGDGEGGAAAQLLEVLRAAGVELTVEGDKLRYRAPPGALTDELRAGMKAYKADLLALLKLEVGTSECPPTVPTSGVNGQLCVSPSPRLPIVPEVGTGGELHIPPGVSSRIPLDDLIYGDFLARHRLRIVGGTAYPDGRSFRPTLYLAEDVG